MVKIRRKINGELLAGCDVNIENLKEKVEFDNWKRLEINQDIMKELGIRKNNKALIKIYASGSNIPTITTGAVFGICEARQDGTIIDRDHIIGYKINDETIFLTHDKDKSKKHNYKNLIELKRHIDENPPHEKD